MNLLLQWFTHERGTYISIYALALLGSNFLAPILSGFINDGQSWGWVLVGHSLIISTAKI